MAQNDVLKRYIDAGLAFTALTQARAEALVKDLVKVGRGAGGPGPRRGGRPPRAQPQEQREAARDRPHRGAPADHQPRARHARPTSTASSSGSRSVIGTVATAPRARAGEEGRRQEGAGQEGGRKKKAPAKKAAAKKAREEGRRQEGAGGQAPRRSRRPRRRPRRPERWRAAASTPSSCGGAWRPAASRRRPTSPPDGSPSAAPRPTSRPGSSRPDEPIRVLGPGPRFVGRGGEKLDAALDRFDVAVDGSARLRPRGVDRRVHRLPPAARRGVGGGGRRRLRPAPRAAARRPPGRGPRAHQRPRPAARRPRARRPSCVVADLSFISLRTVLPARARRWPRTGPTWCSS